jgi:four helix bundle protein
MTAKTVEELQVYQRSLAAADAILAMLQFDAFHDDFDLRRQLSKGARRIPSDIAEGFEQKTDSHFAHYLYIARGAARELCTQLAIAQRRKLISDSEREGIEKRYDEIAKMLTGLIKYLERSDRRNRFKPDRD